MFHYKLLIKKLLFILSKPFSALLPVAKGRWVVGGDREFEIEGNSLCFVEYLLAEQSQIDVMFITRRRSVVESARKKGVRVCHNYSLRGLYYALTAEVYVYSISTGDILMVSPGKTLFVNLFHGAALKKIIYDAEASSLVPSRYPRRERWHDPIVPHSSADLILTTSDFFVPFMRTAFLSNRVEPLGLPRNDALMREASDPGRIAQLKARIGCAGKVIVTYMPTHRNYGNSTPPVLFEQRVAEVRERFGENVVFLTKQHPLSAGGHPAKLGETVFVLPHGVLTTHEVLILSDCLVTDYSSVFVDFLLLRRPVLFYCYDLKHMSLDNFYFFGRNVLPGPISECESRLLDDISIALGGGRDMGADICSVYHKHCDDRSSDRVFLRIGELLKKRRGGV